MFSFQINSPQIRNNLRKDPISTHEIIDYICRQFASSHLINKLQLKNLGEIDCGFRRVVVDIVLNNPHIWLTKSFTNFTSTAYQLLRQGLVTTEVCQMHNADKEVNSTHVLCCNHALFEQHRHKIISLLQLKIINLLDTDMFLSYLLEQMLKENFDTIKGVPNKVMETLQSTEKRNIWYRILLTKITNQIKWKIG